MFMRGKRVLIQPDEPPTLVPTTAAATPEDMFENGCYAILAFDAADLES